MRIVEDASGTARRAAHAATREVDGWIEWTARIGFGALGVVYLIVGILAAQAATGDGGETTDAQGALHVIGQQPFGTALLWITAIGLLGYALWRFIQAATDPGSQGAGRRAINAIKGIAHAVLGVSAARLAMGDPDSGSSGNGMMASIAGNPAGRWLIIAAAAALAIYGIKQAADAIRRKLDEDLDLSSMSSGTRAAVLQIARWGIAARGIVFAALGFLIARAAWSGAGGEDQDTGQALDLLAGLPGGGIILGAIAIGLMAYGVYCFINARYRRIETT